ncbi:uncharacterized protein LOC122086089 isoform X2 [Macadamia integrifolia]|uniref:uncharacterized protein LOC122086089 isoform X2 n=1 Tax=Macadamia integrifolia TaxID=60698 RepID=UPI001C4FD119|nr:uncharacterized protein LOC122086089 isoform X2 [Macadamia integrifolia]
MEPDIDSVIAQIQLNIKNNYHEPIVHSVAWSEEIYSRNFSYHRHNEGSVSWETCRTYADVLTSTTSDFILKPWTCTRVDGPDLLVFQKVKSLDEYMNALTEPVIVDTHYGPLYASNELQHIIRIIVKGLEDIQNYNLKIVDIPSSVVITDCNKVKFIQLIKGDEVDSFNGYLQLIEVMSLEIPYLRQLDNFRSLLRTTFYGHPFFWKKDDRFKYILTLHAILIGEDYRFGQQTINRIGDLVRDVVLDIEYQSGLQWTDMVPTWRP